MHVSGMPESWRLFLAPPLAAGLLAALTVPAAADTGHGGKSVDPAQALATSQAAMGRLARDQVFLDAEGRQVRLSQFRGKPLVVNFIYTSCAHTCPVITETLTDAAADARDAVGKDAFNVITVGFEVGVDTPGRMASFARRTGARAANWKFLSGGPEAVGGLTRDLGFVFFPSPKGYDHLAQVTVLDGDGRVYRQIYGETFPMPLLVEPLKELAFGTAAPFASLDDLVKKVRLFCTVYDPALGRYRFDYGIFIRMGVGGMFVLLLGVFVVRQWRRLRRGRGNTAA